MGQDPPEARESTRCRVCRSERQRWLCDTPSRHTAAGTLSHYRCLECGSVFVGNELSPETLRNAYSSFDAERYYQEIASTNQKKMLRAIEHLRTRLPRTAPLLDIGTGDGSFVKLLHDDGFRDVSCHEILGADLTGVQGIAERTYQDLDYQSIPSDHFEAVTLLDVLEHVRTPSELLATCSRVLRPRGLLYLHTPVVTPTDRFMHRVQRLPAVAQAGRLWQNGRTSIFHLQNFTRHSLELLLRNAGFEDVNISIQNELSWPVARYVRAYLLEKHGLPTALAPLITPIFHPLLATNLFNANKAIVSARKGQ